MAKGKTTRADLKREEQRKQLWPDSGELIWKGPDETGYWCAPRILPLLLHLTNDKRIVGEKDCSTVYVELFSRTFGQGIVEIRDEEEHAFCAGYTSSRAKRTWQERVQALANAGLIEVKPKGNRSIGYVLLLHPVQVACSLRRQRKVSDEWWGMLQQQLLDYGADVPADPLSTRELHVISGGASQEHEVPVSRRPRS